MVGVVMLVFMTSCDDECPADEGTVTVKVTNVEKLKDEAHLYMIVKPCYEGTPVLYELELTQKDNYTKSVALNTGDYVIRVIRAANPSADSYGLLAVEIMQIRRGQNVKITIDEKNNKTTVN